MLVTIGDLVEDVVVHLAGPINHASDTECVVTRRRGGSAANMASTAARLGHAVRFVGQVGHDDVGVSLVDALRADGVETVVRRSGRTGSVVCLVDPSGERTMLADRAACVDLSPADPTWLDGADTLHVPLYSFAGGPLADTSRDLVALAHERGVRVSVDASSVGVMDALGHQAVLAMLGSVRPDVLFCNADEAVFLGADLSPSDVGAALLVVKRGPGPATVTLADGSSSDVAAHHLDGVTDTTGAGDAFAAGFLLALAHGASAVEAASAGHSSAATLLTSPR